MAIFHVDVNSAFLSWSAVRRLEQGEAEDLRTIASAVGGDPLQRRGIVLAKSGPARARGVRTGETLWEARQKCPALVVVPPEYDLYMRCSQALFEMLGEYTPRVERYSIDECFLDVSFSPGRCPEELGEEIRQRVSRELGFTVNVGISCNKLLAKMASEREKPDRMHTLYPEEIPQKMWPLPAEELFMVGRATRKRLRRMNIRTIGDLAHTDPGDLERVFRSFGLLLHAYARGIDHSAVRERDLIPRSVGHSTTTPFDVTRDQEARMVLLALTEKTAMRLRRTGLRAGVVSVHLRTADREGRGRQRRLPFPTDCTGELYGTARELLEEIWEGQPLRHLGVSFQSLCRNDYYQVPLGGIAEREQQEKLDRTLDGLREKYGNRILVRGCFLHSGIEPLQGGASDGGILPPAGSF